MTNSFLGMVTSLLELQVGDVSRLEHIKKTILENKSLYASDQRYVENLAIKYNISNSTKTDESDKGKFTIKCHRCNADISVSATYCSSCGVRKDFEQKETRTLIKKYSPLHILHVPKSYQILATMGGLTVILPVLFIVSRIDPLLIAINYETGSDISELAGVFIFLGVFSSVLSAISIVITFVVKNSKKVGKVLFFMSFAILITSILIGVVGFVLLLLASNFAYKKRYY